MKRRHVLAGIGSGVGGLYLYGRRKAAQRDEPPSGGIMAGPPPGWDATAVEAGVVDEINELRAGLGLEAVTRSDALDDAARAHSNDMIDRDYFAHESPEGKRAWDRAPCRASETLHRSSYEEVRPRGADATFDAGETDGAAESTVVGWRESPEHYDVLTAANASRVGVGVGTGNEKFVVTANFC